MIDPWVSDLSTLLRDTAAPMGIQVSISEGHVLARAVISQLALDCGLSLGLATGTPIEREVLS